MRVRRSGNDGRVEFAYQAVFLLPLALAIIGAVLAWALSRDVDR